MIDTPNDHNAAKLAQDGACSQGTDLPTTSAPDATCLNFPGVPPVPPGSIAGAEQNYQPGATAAGNPQAAGAAAEHLPDPFGYKPPEIPTQEGPRGIRFDFNDGARVLLPQGAWHVRILDEEAGNILFACDADSGWVVSTKKYYVQLRIMVWERGVEQPVLDHTMDLAAQPVLIAFPVGTLGDIMGWFHYAEKFLEKHKCRLHCTLGQELIDLVQAQYPDMTMSTPAELHKYMPEPYATYRVGLYFGGNQDNQPFDFRYVGLHRTAGYILGVDPAEAPPRLRLDGPREIKEPYVCIAVKSTSLAKMWNNGFGWSDVIDNLKAMGYRVLCIDRTRTVGMHFTWNQLPHGVEDFTGDQPLQKRVDLLRHADFFVGLSSGLSWLAWATGIPVVMISGFTLPICEFNTPYRVINTHGCTGCWDDIRERFDHTDYFWCPRHKGTDRQFECTRLITGKQVMGHITRLMRDHSLTPPRERG